MHSIPSSVAQALQQGILSGAYPAGSRLPPQRELAESLGVSRASLREALTVLETLGLVDILPSRGVVVRGQMGAERAGAERMHRPFATPALGTLSPRQLIELRLVLEPGWTALAAARMQAAGLRHLQWLQQQLAHALARNDLLSAAEADLHFHMLLAQLSGNPGLMAMAGQLEHAIGHSLRLPFARNGADDHPAHEHDAIVQAVAAGDAAASADAMRAHLLSAARRSGIDLSAPQSSLHPASEPAHQPPVSFRLVPISEGVLE
ncbi:FadR/GntR family transcriptional regulator [Ralstonia soli]|uniref:FCD domain-containing protein n=1 Tax=Ralstonia soli TaxID=2953896 RepID=A0ABT1AF14_9RALS|nr:FCD domain-containing protein [Ralstonia soli]MCO5396904.1 FCD domain-containing protein [Ralstonia soli]